MNPREKKYQFFPEETAEEFNRKVDSTDMKIDQSGSTVDSTDMKIDHQEVESTDMKVDESGSRVHRHELMNQEVESTDMT